MLECKYVLVAPLKKLLGGGANETRFKRVDWYVTELNTKYTPYNCFTKPRLGDLHKAIEWIVYFQPFLVN